MPIDEIGFGDQSDLQRPFESKGLHWSQKHLDFEAKRSFDLNARLCNLFTLVAKENGKKILRYRLENWHIYISAVNVQKSTWLLWGITMVEAPILTFY